MNSEVRWIDAILPAVDVSVGKCIVWDICRDHTSKSGKEHCQRRNIKTVVLSDGCTPYLQAVYIGISRELKDRLSNTINAWKNSDDVTYTRGGSPKPPTNSVVESWLRDSWNPVGIKSAGFYGVANDWHISKHDVYGIKLL